MTSYFDCAKSLPKAHALSVVSQHDWQVTVPPLSPTWRILCCFTCDTLTVLIRAWQCELPPSPRGVRGWVGGLIDSLMSCCACKVVGCVHQSIKESIWSYRSLHSSIFVIIYVHPLTHTWIITYMYMYSLIHIHTMILYPAALYSSY